MHTAPQLLRLPFTQSTSSSNCVPSSALHAASARSRSSQATQAVANTTTNQPTRAVRLKRTRTLDRMPFIFPVLGRRSRFVTTGEVCPGLVFSRLSSPSISDCVRLQRLSRAILPTSLLQMPSKNSTHNSRDRYTPTGIRSAALLDPFIRCALACSPGLCPPDDFLDPTGSCDRTPPATVPQRTGVQCDHRKHCG